MNTKRSQCNAAALRFSKYIGHHKKNWLTFGHALVWSVFHTQFTLVMPMLSTYCCDGYGLYFEVFTKHLFMDLFEATAACTDFK